MKLKQRNNLIKPNFVYYIQLLTCIYSTNDLFCFSQRASPKVAEANTKLNIFEETEDVTEKAICSTRTIR